MFRRSLGKQSPPREGANRSHSIRLREIIRPFLQDQGQEVSIIDQVATKEWRSKFGHPRAVKTGGCGKYVFPEKSDVLPKTDLSGRAIGFGGLMRLYP